MGCELRGKRVARNGWTRMRGTGTQEKGSKREVCTWKRTLRSVVRTEKRANGGGRKDAMILNR